MRNKNTFNSVILAFFIGWLGTVIYAQELGPPPEAFINVPYAADNISREAAVLPVDTHNRTSVVNFFNQEYLSYNGVAAQWTGDAATCVSGTTSANYEQATLRRINYFRSMSALPAVASLDATLNPKCQNAALMMSAKGALSHTPDSSWPCYKDNGAEAAGKSNLALGASGPDAIDLYIYDFGDFNVDVGHRRWV
ncbi:MAG: CAP domain-containing protein, partial [Candidatus Sumerlaeota bacterium]|nr:CAP domain-containing protein [Candidatus Sumerlaeota bacterium]